MWRAQSYYLCPVTLASSVIFPPYLPGWQGCSVDPMTTLILYLATPEEVTHTQPNYAIDCENCLPKDWHMVFSIERSHSQKPFGFFKRCLKTFSCSWIRIWGAVMAAAVEGRIQPGENKLEIKAKVLRTAYPLMILLGSWTNQPWNCSLPDFIFCKIKIPVNLLQDYVKWTHRYGNLYTYTCIYAQIHPI